jgi:streptogramin lyase
VEVIVTEKKKPSKARFSAEAEVVGKVDAQGNPYETTSGESHLYRTKGGKSKYMGFSLPDAKAEEYASELQRETRGMKKGGTASSRADGIAQRGKTRGMMK